MSYARPPTEGESIELQRLIRQASGRVSQRAQVMLLSAQRDPVPALATLCAVSQATVRFWLRRFNVQGPAGLYDDPRRGRPLTGGPQGRETRLLRRQGAPRQAGDLATCGTVAMLGLVLAQKLGVWLSSRTLRAPLQELGRRWGRPRLAMPLKVDPAKARQPWLRAQAVLEAGPEAAVLYAEESRLQLLPWLRALWHWAGNCVGPRLARRSREPCSARCIAARDAGCLGSAGGCVKRMAWLAWSSSRWPLPKGPSCSSWISSAATRPTP
jgi:transposase